MHVARVLASVLVLCAPTTAFAGTIHVPADYPTIQQAIDAAVDGDVVQVAAGTYQENLNLKGKEITLQGAGRGKSILDGSKGGPVITMASGETPSTIVRGFSIKLGTGKKIGSKRYGGGVYISNKSSPTIEGDTAIGFNTAARGAGLFIDKGCAPLLQDVLIANNVTANKGVGAGLYVLGSPTFDNLRIAENTATNGTGGGMYLEKSSSVIENSEFDKNHALYGGGLLVKSGAPTIRDNLFEENEVVSAPINGEAGGLGIAGGAKPLVTGNTFRFNQAHTGAGIWAWDSKPTIVLNRIHDNVASARSGKFGYGGGLALGKTRGSVELNEIYFNTGVMGGGLATRGGTTALLLGNLIDHNDVGAGGQGGGVFSKDSSPTILANTIAYNDAGDGGGLFVTGKSAPTLDTSIVWGNVAAANPSFFDGTGKLKVLFSDIEGGSVGSSSLSVDPLFVDPASRNFRLGPGSPVVDAGNSGFSGSGNDVYGNSRVNGGRIDMGAAEQ